MSPEEIERQAASLERCGGIYVWLAGWVRHDNREMRDGNED